MNEIKIKLLSPDAKPLTFGRPGDAAMDIYSTEEVYLRFGTISAIHTGIAVEFEGSHVALIKGRSGLAAKGVAVLGGVIDSTYRGEWIVILTLLNIREDSLYLHIKKGDRIAQVVFCPIATPSVCIADELSNTTRSTNGFGSSGV